MTKTYTYQYKTADEVRVGDKIIYDRLEKEVVDIDDGIFYTMLTFADGITAYVTSETQFRYKQYDKPVVETKVKVSKPRLRRTLAGNWICHKDGDFGTGETPELAYLRCLSFKSFKGKLKDPNTTMYSGVIVPNPDYKQTGLAKIINWVKRRC